MSYTTRVFHVPKVKKKVKKKVTNILKPIDNKYITDKISKSIPININTLSTKKYKYNRNIIIKKLNSYLYNKKRKLSNLKYTHNRCFIIGNGPSIINFDFTLLKNEITICCNYFMRGMKEKQNIFTPTILCAGDRGITKDYLSRDLQYIKKKNPIIIIHPSNQAFFSHKSNKKFLINYRKYKNIYSIENFKNKKLKNGFINKRDFSKNMNEYCKKYRTVIPMISMFIACELLGFNEIYLLGCDFNNFLVHFYKQKTTNAIRYNQYPRAYRGFIYRSNEYNKKKIKIYNCNINSNLKMFPFAKLTFNADIN